MTLINPVQKPDSNQPDAPTPPVDPNPSNWRRPADVRRDIKQALDNLPEDVHYYPEMMDMIRANHRAIVNHILAGGDSEETRQYLSNLKRELMALYNNQVFGGE